MHVLQLSWEFPPHLVGGMGRHVAELAPALAAAGLRVSVVTPQLRGGPDAEQLAPGLNIYRIPMEYAPGADYPHYVALCNRELERAALSLQGSLGRFDLIHTHDWLTAQSAARLKHLWQTPLIATVHATERGRGRGILHGRAAQQINDQEWLLTYEAWRIIVCSQFMLGEVTDSFHTPSDKIDVVPNGITLIPDPFAASSDEERRTFRRRFLPDDAYLVFYVGRIVAEKGLQVLIEAWPQIMAGANAHLIIAGTGGYREILQAQAEAAGLQDVIHFAGFMSDEERDKIYRVADVAVFPSLYEPFGIVALEASAAGCPLVVSDAGGLAEVVRHGETGMIAAAGDPFALAAAVLDCLHEPEQAQMRAAAAFAEVQRAYTWDIIAASTIQIYARVLAEWQAGNWGK
ncbi:glycosyl transferase group 1 [Oscillochloris trichoides DG-6]|uniref:Glycosyl transferase group 1 n=1 Tax=Oscillochloris trichoides DG-6 TaxID=765420 RepID=E1IE70_9CHLR|nr:glycosyltransferase family 4 protein [Oscillochloris trichoides]EFO80530.1 glycosyl transferase group 1 [Oscillochloris trichoides DG-6]